MGGGGREIKGIVSVFTAACHSVCVGGKGEWILVVMVVVCVCVYVCVCVCVEG